MPAPPGRQWLTEITPSDYCRSSARLMHSHDDRDVVMTMEIRHYGGLLGALTLRATTGHADGKLRFEGVALYTRDEIVFGRQEE